MNLLLKRNYLRTDCTLGTLSLGDFHCATLEPSLSPSLPEVGRGIIPPGRYRLNWQWSNHFGKNMPFLDNVPGFTGIMIHPGNTAKDTRGCILVGQPSGTNKIVNSRKTFAELEALLRSTTDPIWLTICN